MEGIAKIVALLVSHLEHFRTTRSSILLPFYLFTTILLDISRLRTFKTIRASDELVITFTATIGLRFLCFVVENVEKGWLVKELHLVSPNAFVSSRSFCLHISLGYQDLELSPEETASFISRVFFVCMPARFSLVCSGTNLTTITLGSTPLLFRGARSQLTLSTLPPISRSFSSAKLYPIGNTEWLRQLSLKSTSHPLLWTLLRAFPSALMGPIIPCVIYSFAMVTKPMVIEGAVKFIESYQHGGGCLPPAQGWGLAVGGFLLYCVCE